MPRKVVVPLIAIFLLLLLLFTKGVGNPPAPPIPAVDTPVLGRTLHYIERNYLENPTLQPRKLLQDTLSELERSISPFVAKISEKKIELRYAHQDAILPLSPQLTVDDLPQLLRQVIGFIQLHYQGRLEPKEREYIAASGLVEGLDSHSNFLPPKVYQEFRIGTRGNFGGLGIVIGIRDGQLTVIAPLEETPAWKAGIKAKDRIVQIGEEATINMSLTEAVEKLRGPIGSTVSLVVTRDGVPEPLPFTLHRALIEIQSVAGRLLEGKQLALIKIRNFQEDTVEDFDQLIGKLRKESSDLKGLILDLRNNPGGLLDQAVSLGDRFLKEGVIVKTVGPRYEEAEQARPGESAESIPMVVLVNEGSASASEIIAGALKFNERALVIGHRTFGKGTVQTVFDLKDGSALKLTIAKYLTAGDHEVHNVGIEPDLELFPISVGKEGVNLFPSEKEKESSVPKIPYLEKTGSKEEESVGLIHLEEDFPIQMARSLLETPGSNRAAWLEKSAPLIAATGRKQDELLAQALQAIGIDWTIGEKKGRAKVALKITLEDETGAPRTSLVPGGSAFLRVEAHNTGSAPLFQFAVTTQSEDPTFNQLEFPFGRLDPKGKKEWKYPLKIADAAPARSEPVTFQPHEALGRGTAPVIKELVVGELPAPLFSYLYEIKDGGFGKTTGNRNGRIEAGEVAALRIQIKNEGKGESPEPILNLRNLGGPEVFIETGRAELKSLMPGESAATELLVRIPRSPAADHLQLELSLQDKKRGQELVDRLELPLANSSYAPPVGVWQRPPRLDLETVSLSTSDATYRIKGVARDDQEVRHLFFFVGEVKQVYLAPDEQSPSFPFDAKLTLKEGINVVTAAVQDPRELTTRRQWIVWRKK